MPEKWIEPGGGVKQWRELNKYKDGRPISWICNYVNLLSNDDYLDLSGDQRAILHGLWLAFASARAHLRLDTRSLSRRLGLRVTSAQLELLEQAGWLRLSVTKPSRARYGFVTSRDAREGEGRSEEEELKNQTPVARGLGEQNGAAEDIDDISFEIPTDLTKAMPK